MRGWELLDEWERDGQVTLPDGTILTADAKGDGTLEVVDVEDNTAVLSPQAVSFLGAVMGVEVARLAETEAREALDSLLRLGTGSTDRR